MSFMKGIRAKLIVPKVAGRVKADDWSFGSNRAQQSGFIKNAYYNGLGRHVCQLQRVTFKFSLNSGSGKGLRDFIEKDLVNYSRANPGVAIYLKPRFKPTPVMVTEYLNGTSHWLNIRLFTKEQVVEWLQLYTDRSGTALMRFRKPHQTEWPTVQGVWTPFLRLPSSLNLSQFPNPERGDLKPLVPTATQQLLALQEEGEDASHILQSHPHTK